MNQIKKFLLVLLTSFSFCFGFSDTATLMQMLEQGYRKLQVVNDQLKTATETLNVINTANDTITSMEKHLFDTGMKIYNPAENIMRFKQNLEAIESNMLRAANRVKNMNVYDRFFTDEWHCKLVFSSSEDENEFNKQVEAVKAQSDISLPEIKRKACLDRELDGKNLQALKTKYDNEIKKAVEENRYDDAKKIMIEKNNRILNYQNQESAQRIALYKKAINEIKNENLNNLKDKKIDDISTIIENIKKVEGSSCVDITSCIQNTNKILNELATIAIKNYESFLKYSNAMNNFLIAYEKTSMNPNYVTGSENKVVDNNSTETDKNLSNIIKFNLELTPREKELIDQAKPKYNALGIPIF